MSNRESLWVYKERLFGRSGMKTGSTRLSLAQCADILAAEKLDGCAARAARVRSVHQKALSKFLERNTEYYNLHILGLDYEVGC